MEATPTLKFEHARSNQTEIVAEIIRLSFAKQVELLGITQEVHPNYAGFETAERVEARMKLGARVTLLFLGEKPVGTLSFVMDGNRVGTGYIERMAVLPEFRGRGLGNALLEYAEQQLVILGVSIARLSIVAQFSKLQQFYERAGYVSAGRMAPHGLPFEVLFMERSLM